MKVSEGSLTRRGLLLWRSCFDDITKSCWSAKLKLKQRDEFTCLLDRFLSSPAASYYSLHFKAGNIELPEDQNFHDDLFSDSIPLFFFFFFFFIVVWVGCSIKINLFCNCYTFFMRHCIWAIINLYFIK